MEQKTSTPNKLQRKIPVSTTEEPSEADHADEPRDLTRSSRIIQATWTLQTVATLGLFILALLYTLHIAKDLVLPVVLAVLLSILLTPLVAWLARWLPQSLASAVVLAVFVSGVGVAAWFTAAPAQEWFSELPRKAASVERRTKKLMQPVTQIKEAAEQVAEMTNNGKPKTPKVQVTEDRPLADSLFSLTREFLGLVAVMIGLLYFFLATGDSLLRKLVRILPAFADKRRTVTIVRGIQKDVARHLLTITAINSGLGLLLGSALAVMGVENPAFWGVLAAILNFIPYLGAVVGIGFLTLSSMMATDSSSFSAFVPPLIYFALTALEGTFITPMILGKRLKLNPVIVFVGILFWAWLWGVAGALIAVPLLVMLKVICDNVLSLQGIGELMGD